MQDCMAVWDCHAMQQCQAVACCLPCCRAATSTCQPCLRPGHTGYNVTRAMGVKLAKLTPSRGFCAELATAFIIMIAAQ